VVNDTNEAVEKLCRHSLLEGDIHLFELHGTSQQVVDVFMALLDQKIDTNPQGQTFLYIIDMRADGMPAIQYFYQSTMNWVKFRQNFPRVRTVFLIEPSAIVVLGDTFANLVSRALHSDWQWKFVTEGGIEAAAAWLRGR
jgi:hypothetical protein